MLREKLYNHQLFVQAQPSPILAEFDPLWWILAGSSFLLQILLCVYDQHNTDPYDTCSLPLILAKMPVLVEEMVLLKNTNEDIEFTKEWF